MQRLDSMRFTFPKSNILNVRERMPLMLMVLRVVRSYFICSSYGMSYVSICDVCLCMHIFMHT